MFKKPALMTAFGIGYVLGARAGRERYDAIAAKAQKLWHDPRVQDKAHRAGFVAKEKAASAKHTVQDKMPGDTKGSTSPTEPAAPASPRSYPQTTPSGPRPTTTDPVTDMPRGWES
ncbi:hypothetical protein ACFVJS_10695 [Nocardioides sp. NPDC057772]|uniref:hypothetical protein n=1 Tax=Nocardioides sp. NPDC057772 TaxID=3346245 RepID=UPI00366A7CAE